MCAIFHKQFKMLLTSQGKEVIRKMFMVAIEEEKCIGCAQCTQGCPAQILGMVGAKAEVTGDASECMGCQSCVMTCPAEAITVTEY
jgi:NAD-dependent dihydropyrimidine dehydrogenase PreA subunit